MADNGNFTDSGIDVMGEVRWGNHTTVFYHQGDDLLDLLGSYFEPGLVNNELCVWITPDSISPEEALKHMESSTPGFQDRVDGGQIEVIDHEEWYLRGGSFRGKKILDRWMEKQEDALSRGYAGLRVTGDMSWVDGDIWDRFVAYEGLVNGVIGDQRMIAFCTYPLDRIDRNQISEVVDHHQTAIWAGAEAWDTSTWSSKRVVGEVLGRKRMMRSLMALPSSPDFIGRFERTSRKLAEAMDMQEAWEVAPALIRMNDLMAREIEGESGIKLAALDRDSIDLKRFSEELSRLYHLASDGVSVSADGRSIRVDVRGCRYSDSCNVPRSSIVGCLPDHLASAVFQAVTETPVGLTVKRDGGVCSRVFSPSWATGLLETLRDAGARSIAVICGDRVIHTHVSSDADREVLNRAILKNEEAEGGDIPPQTLVVGGSEVLFLRTAGIFMAFTLESGGADDALGTVFSALVEGVRALKLR